MQDRYVGDAGDFGKYGLLRYLGASSGLRMGVVWYLVDDEAGNRDGRHVGYLSDGSLIGCDPELRAKLKAIVKGGKRDIRLVERQEILPESTVFFSERLQSSGGIPRTARVVYRQEWFVRALSATRKCGLVFLDPDNGLEVLSVPRGSPKFCKYVSIEEVQALLSRGQSVIVYQHLHRMTRHHLQVAELLMRLRKACPHVPSIVAATYRRGSARTFLLLTSPTHDALLNRRLDCLQRSCWSPLFAVSYDLDGVPTRVQPSQAYWT